MKIRIRRLSLEIKLFQHDDRKFERCTWWHKALRGFTFHTRVILWNRCSSLSFRWDLTKKGARYWLIEFWPKETPWNGRLPYNDIKMFKTEQELKDYLNDLECAGYIPIRYAEVGEKK